MKTITLPIEEYEQLLQDSKDKQQLMQENNANADEKTTLSRRLMALECRGFWARVFNKKK